MTRQFSLRWWVDGHNTIREHDFCSHFEITLYGIDMQHDHNHSLLSLLPTCNNRNYWLLPSFSDKRLMLLKFLFDAAEMNNINNACVFTDLKHPTLLRDRVRTQDTGSILRVNCSVSLYFSVHITVATYEVFCSPKPLSRPLHNHFFPIS